MTTITFDIELFRERFTEFADDAIYTDAALTVNWDMASCFISTEDYGCLHGSCREQAVQLMTAHIQTLMDRAAAGQGTALITSATVDKVSVSATPPPNKDQLQWWLNTTPYGAMLWAMLSMMAAGGFYLGGSPEIQAFRGVGGGFGSYGHC